MKQCCKIKIIACREWLREHPYVVGLGILFLAFALEKISDHFIWLAFLETARAAGVVPIWDTISNFFNIYSKE